MRQILVVDHYSPSILGALKKLAAADPADKFGILLFTRHPEKYTSLNDELIPITVIKADFDDSAALQSLLAPFYDSLAAVLCRGDKQVQFLRKVVPLLPENVLVASPESLQAATNKRQMRELFQSQYPEITPAFIRVTDYSEATVARVCEHVPYPVIVKPAGLVSSLLITACRNEDELRQALKRTFAAIEALYRREERQDGHEVIVEEFLEGDFYSIDSYILDDERVFYCPPVFYLPAQKIGIDDFFLYKRYVPTDLTVKDVADANEAAKKCLLALGLHYTTAHVELIKTTAGWKIIEVGPRVGRFRNSMYRYGYNIDHSLNDILVHLGREPIIPTELKQYCAAYSIYPHQEGVLSEITNINQLGNKSGVYSFKLFARLGDRVLYAKHGGKALAEFIIAHKDKDEFMALTRYIEEDVKAIIDLEKS